MSNISRQIGWSQESNLLSQILKYLNKLSKITANINVPSTPIGGVLNNGVVYVNSAGAFEANSNFFSYDSSTKVLQLTGVTETLSPGTATLVPLKLSSGSLLTSAVAGGIEYDGINIYTTAETTSGRGVLPTAQQFVLSASGSPFGPTVGNFFGANSAISLAASTTYDIEAFCYFLKTTAGTSTWAPTLSSAATVLHSFYESTPITGFTTSVITGAMVASEATANTITTATHAASGSLTSAVSHIFKFKIRVTTNAACNFRLNVTQSAGTITPLAGSYYIVRKVKTSAGTYVA